MTLKELFSVQKDLNKLKSLKMELEDMKNFNPYKPNVMSDMPKGSGGKDTGQWYVEEKERIEKEIEFYQRKLQEDRAKVNAFIDEAPYPECDIIRFRVINDLSWGEIGKLVNYSRTGASAKFYNYIRKVCHNCHD